MDIALPYQDPMVSFLAKNEWCTASKQYADMVTNGGFPGSEPHIAGVCIHESSVTSVVLEGFAVPFGRAFITGC